MWTRGLFIFLACISLLVSSDCEAEEERVELLSGDGVGVFCHGVLLLRSFVLLPAHCTVAARKLQRVHLRIKNRVSRERSVSWDSLSVLVYPEFRLISFDKRDVLHHDIALIVIRNKTRRPRQRRRDRTINILSGSHKLGERKTLSLSGAKFEVTDERECDPQGLAPAQLCLETPGNKSVDARLEARQYFGRLDLDPRQGYYRGGCLHHSGRPLWNTEDCRVEAIVLLSDCEQSRVIALDINLYKDWIRTAILTDTLKHKTFRRNRMLRGLFLKELRHSKTCPPVTGKDINLFKRSRKLEHSPGTVISPQAPQFSSMPEDVRVVTDCGVEIRLEKGIVHSPIHYKDVTNYTELVTLLQRDFTYKYRPNQKCEWLITAPTNQQKVGLRFLYFDLHPSYDRLEVTEEGGEVARFRGGDQTRTIISGTDRLRLTFTSDYHQERRGFAVSFQPVNVSQCGGDLTADSGVIQSPNYPLYYPPASLCIWRITVPGHSMVKLQFTSLQLHPTDFIEVREGLTENDDFITSINQNQSEPVFSLTNKMFILFKSNSWGQLAGFSARFSRQNSVCGGRRMLEENSLSISSPQLEWPGVYRRGYVRCRWEVVAATRHFVILNFQEMELNNPGHCSSTFLELSDGVHDTEHTRRYCGTVMRKWFTTSNKLFIEYLFDMEDRKVR